MRYRSTERALSSCLLSVCHEEDKKKNSTSVNGHFCNKGHLKCAKTECKGLFDVPVSNNNKGAAFSADVEEHSLGV